MASIAVVTGATGMVGRRIVTLLLNKGYKVRVLTRNQNYNDSRLEVIHGELQDQSAIDRLLAGAEYLFHCAAELNDEAQMWPINVVGTKNLMEGVQKNSFKYVCHLSSVGVIGKIAGQFANESTPCLPMNMYEKSKYESEKIVRELKSSAKVVILRPTNVIDRHKNSILGHSKLKTFIKGGEHAHIIHAEDVASAAVYFLDKPQATSPECFIVSCDEENLNTIAGCLAICRNIKNNMLLGNVKALPHLSWRIPYLVRRLLKGPCNRGDVRYSSKKILSTGLQFPLGFIGALKDICEDS